MYRERHLQWTHTEESTNTCLLFGEDDLADPDKPGWQVATIYVVICGNSSHRTGRRSDFQSFAVDRALWRGMTRGATHHPGECS